MSWEAYAYLLLALVLVGGFAWYERSRPPARLVALVAALAALAVAGRLVFTPIPNVVATTDIVLIAGYAVGAAPGFAVGALAAVVSNLWLGQGPWPPSEGRRGGGAPPLPGSSAPRTATAASAPIAGPRRAPRSPAGRRSGSRPLGPTPSPFATEAPRRSATCARTARAFARPATSSGPSSRCRVPG